jgi:hypothetical protein
MNFNDYCDYKGHLEVWKLFPDGTEELHFEEDNVVCSGMGASLALAFGASATSDLRNFQITLFQVGTNGDSPFDYQVSSNARLGAAVAKSAYGDSLETVAQSLVASGIEYRDQAFGIISNAYIDKVTDTKVRWRIILDENTCNSEVLNEIGIFSRNPHQTTIGKSYLCAYRKYNDITKTSDFILDFRWTIEF